MNTSESIQNVAMALSKFNSEVGIIEKDGSNPFFKNSYATLDQIVSVVRPILAKNGLSIIQIPVSDEYKIGLKTTLLHESGEYIQSDVTYMTPVKPNDPQSIGSTITYLRRYGLCALLSLNTGDDDDGNKASHEDDSPKSKQNKTNTKQVKSEPKAPTITEAQKKTLMTIAIQGKFHTKAKSIIETFGFNDSSEVTQDKYEEVLQAFKNYKE